MNDNAMVNSKSVSLPAYVDGHHGAISGIVSFVQDTDTAYDDTMHSKQIPLSVLWEDLQIIVFIHT